MQDAIEAVARVFPGSEVIMTKRPCRLCGAPLIFIKGPEGKTMIFDEKPKTAWFINHNESEARSFPAYEPHLATCPMADEIRKRQRGAKNG